MMCKIKYILWSLLTVSLLLSSCGGEDDENSGLSSEELLQQYFTDNNINPQQTDSGLYYVIDNPGSQDRPTRSSRVTVNYRGYFLNGDEFDSGMPATFSLREVIAGWTEGIPLFGRGGGGSLFIPSNLAYGSRGRGNIPGNTPLIFDIELIDFQ